MPQGAPRVADRPRAGNRLLSILSREDIAKLEPHLRPIAFARRAPLLSQNQEPAAVIFPDSGVLSAVRTLPCGSVLEVGMVGKDGVIGAHVAFDQRGLPWSLEVQVPGHGRTLPPHVFRSELDRRDALWQAVTRYEGEWVRQLSALAVCNHYHSLQQRCARWLLMAHDREPAGEFPITHDDLAGTLGGHRPSVSLALEHLQAAGAIDCRRGTVTLLDRRELARAACPCYGLLEV